MSYYGQGDYYGRGGLFDVVKGIGKAAVGFVTGGPAGAISSVVGQIAGSRGSGYGGGPVLPTVNPPFAGLPGAGIQIGPTRLSISEPAGLDARPGGRYVTRDGRPRRIRKDGQPWKRPTMDPGNVKALRRADRRLDRFVGIAKSALKHTHYKVVTKGSGTRRRK